MDAIDIILAVAFGGFVLFLLCAGFILLKAMWRDLIGTGD